jgi:hypothetical protein
MLAAGTDFVGLQPEYSRDIEPIRGHMDNYYYQLVDFVQIQGVRPIPTAKTDIRSRSTGPSKWKAVEPEFRDTIDDTEHRNERAGDSLRRHIGPQ